MIEYILEYDKHAVPVTTTGTWERTVILRDANVRIALSLLEEDLKALLSEYDEATTLLGEKIEEVLRRYDATI